MMTRAPAPYRGDDKLLFGIILGVLAFWLFAQTTLNIAPTMAADLEVTTNVMNIAVSITALFSGIFIVVAGRLEQGVFLLDDAVVIREGLNERRRERDDRFVEEFSPRFRVPADDVEHVGVENDRVQLAQVFVQRLFFAVDAEHLRVALKSDLKVVVDLFRLRDAAADDG